MFKQFKNDYSEGAHEEILEAVLKVNKQQNKSYGLDSHSKNAEKLILKTFNCQNGAVYFVSGGTQANLLVLSFLLKNFEGIISCDTGHINIHETGAIEGTGHKIITCPNENGKLLPKYIEEVCKKHTDEHMVKPKAVYISDSTEVGTIYSKQELLQLRKMCDKYGLLLFLDGARLGVALTCKDNNVEPSLVGEICDVFLIGGTKNGFLSGEAIVFKNKSLSQNFRYHLKNKGALLAKGFIVGTQFEKAFTDNLYFKISTLTNKSAEYLKSKLEKNINFVYKPSTNQFFIKLPANKANILIKEFGCELWNNDGKYLIIRIVTSFTTTLNDCDSLVNCLLKL